MVTDYSKRLKPKAGNLRTKLRLLLGGSVVQGVGFACLTSVPSFAAPENPLSGPELLEELIKPRGPRWPHDRSFHIQQH